MDRRTALRAVACGAVPLVVGCTGGGDPPAGTATSPGGDDRSPRVTNRSFTLTATECGLADEPPAARFTPEPPEPDATTATVRITGTIGGNDTCHTARLADLRFVDSELRAAVESYVPEDREKAACSQCLVAIDYELTVTTAGDLPTAVVVVHDGERAGRVALG